MRPVPLIALDGFHAKIKEHGERQSGRGGGQTHRPTEPRRKPKPGGRKRPRRKIYGVSRRSRRHPRYRELYGRETQRGCVCCVCVTVRERIYLPTGTFWKVFVTISWPSSQKGGVFFRALLSGRSAAFTRFYRVVDTAAANFEVTVLCYVT